jgi:hypothetical protein
MKMQTFVWARVAWGSSTTLEGDRMLPNFICIGAQKSGTTWLHNMLAQHPDICMPVKKELFFFDMKENFERLGREGYEGYFAHHDGEPAVGEITPAYLWTRAVDESYDFNAYRRGTAQRVRSLLGSNVKLVVLLRHPVWRAVSAYVHHMHRQRIRPGENIMSAGKRHGILSMGFYSRNLEPWLEAFEPKNVLVKSYDEIKADKKHLLRDVYSFLGVREDFSPAEQEKRYMKTRDYLVKNDNVYIFQKRFWRRKIVSRYDVDALHELYADEIETIEEKFDLSLAA